ncbi:MAG: HEPN domain-containing protein [Sulfolobales archaeon]
MSGEYYTLLRKRAERFLVRAVRDLSEGDYDGTCFNAEEAIQLAVKAVLYRYFGENPCIHGSKTLLARLRNLFMDAGGDSIASLLNRFIADNRDALDILEESYII